MSLMPKFVAFACALAICGPGAANAAWQPTKPIEFIATAGAIVVTATVTGDLVELDECLGTWNGRNVLWSAYECECQLGRAQWERLNRDCITAARTAGAARRAI